MGVVALPRAVVPPELRIPGGRWRGPLWVSDGPLEEIDAYWRCVEAFPVSGLWPVLVPVDLRFAATDWFDARLGRAALVEVATRDAAEVLQRGWERACCAPEPFPGLVRRSAREGRPDAEAIWTAIGIAGEIAVRLGLVRVARSADVPAALGWGPRGRCDVAGLSAVLRSWEDRFGARLVLLGVDRIVLSVAAPPTTRRRALGIAAEHRAFCPDALHPRGVAGAASALLRRPVWSFRWDR